jgi:hypothetical protein
LSAGVEEFSVGAKVFSVGAKVFSVGAKVFLNGGEKLRDCVLKRGGEGRAYLFGQMEGVVGGEFDVQAMEEKRGGVLRLDGVVLVVVEEGMSVGGGLGAYLVGATGLYFGLDEGEGVRPRKRGDFCPRGLGATGVRAGDAGFLGVGVPLEGVFPKRFPLAKASVDDGDVRFAKEAFPQACAEVLRARKTLGKEDDAAGVSVEPVRGAWLERKRGVDFARKVAAHGLVKAALPMHNVA